MYVDESGDPGLWDSSTPRHLRSSRHYILTGVIVPVLEWRAYLDAMVDVRRDIRQRYGLFMRAELHGSELINPRGNAAFKRIAGGRKGRVSLYRDALQGMTVGMPEVKIVNVHLNKRSPRYRSSVEIGPNGERPDPERRAWEWLLQRFSNHLQWDCSGDLGMVLPDETNEAKVRRIMRRMRVHNYITSRLFSGTSYSNPIENIVEDPVIRNSQNSYFVQFADLVAHALYRDLYPRGGYRKYNVDRLFDIVDAVLLKTASGADPRGIVHL